MYEGKLNNGVNLPTFFQSGLMPVPHTVTDTQTLIKSDVTRHHFWAQTLDQIPKENNIIVLYPHDVMQYY